MFSIKVRLQLCAIKTKSFDNAKFKLPTLPTKSYHVDIAVIPAAELVLLLSKQFHPST